jgi:hypothetical protein
LAGEPGTPPARECARGRRFRSRDDARGRGDAVGDDRRLEDQADDGDIDDHADDGDIDDHSDDGDIDDHAHNRADDHGELPPERPGARRR